MKQLVVSIALLLTTAILSVGGVWEDIDLWTLDRRMDLVDIEPTGTLAVVAIDVRTLRALDQWPISRRTHARVVDILIENGADQIALDIDLSGESYPEDSAILAEAFARASGRIILPIFFQRDGDRNTTSEIVVTRPMALFEQHAWLGNVNVSPERDGRVRRGSYGVEIDGQFYFSLPALLAGRADREKPFFHTNYSINTHEIPRISYIDLLNGEVGRDQIEGRKFIIGATAVELGDQFAVPKHGVMSGPAIQAMAYETLATGTVIRQTDTPAVIAGLVVIVFAGFFLQRRVSWLQLQLIGIVALVTLQAIGFLLFRDHAIDLNMAAWSAAILLVCSSAILSEIARQRRHIRRQRLENEYRRLLTTSVVNDSPDAIIIADTEGQIEMINPVARQLFAIDGERHALEMRLSEVLPATLLQATEAEGAFPREYLLENSSDPEKTRCLRYTLSHSRVPRTLSDDETTMRELVTYTFHDVTERHAAEEAIRTAHRQEQEASRAKTEFIANMGHELRTPLNAIIGFSELMTTEIFGPLGDGRYRQYATDITDSGRHLLMTVNDILDLSRIDSHKVELVDENIDVAEVTDSCIGIARSWKEAPDKSFVTDYGHGSAALNADASLFKQMLTNLLSNAAKFSKPGGRITIRTAIAADGGLSLAVADTGIGIAAEDIARVTEPFYQADGSLSRSHEGTGLGLALVNAYMNLHGGRLRIESVPHEGTTVTLLFPPDRLRPTEDRAASALAGA